MCVIILVDNHNHSHLAAIAIVSDETKDTFEWLFASLSKATGGLAPSLLYTDADPAMVAAVKSFWLTTKHHFVYSILERTWKNIFLASIVVKNGKNSLQPFVIYIIV